MVNTLFYILAVLDFKLTDSEPGTYLQDIALINKINGQLFSPKLGFKFIELPSFNKTAEELETDLDKWLYTLKNMSTLTQVPASLQQGVFFRFFEQAELNRLSKEDLAIYVTNWKNHSDYINSIAFSRVEGIAEGEMKNKLLTAQTLKQMGFPIDQIFAISGLPIIEIEKLESLNKIDPKG